MDKKKILLVDDSATSRALFKAFIPDDIDIDFYEAGTEQDATAIALDILPDLIVLDYNLQGKNGVELALTLKDKGLSSKMIILSGNIDQSMISDANKASIVDLIDKPVSTAKVRHMLEYIGLR